MDFATISYSIVKTAFSLYFLQPDYMKVYNECLSYLLHLSQHLKQGLEHNRHLSLFNELSINIEWEAFAITESILVISFRNTFKKYCRI